MAIKRAGICYFPRLRVYPGLGAQWQVCLGNKIIARYPESHERKAVAHVRVKMGQTIFPEHPQ